MPAATADPLNHDPARYRDLGYCVFRAALPPADLARARAALDALIGASPTTRPEQLVEPHARLPQWLDLCRHPAVLACARAALGDELILIMSHVIAKPPFDGKRIAWHQDRPTWPSVRGEDIATVWLALDDADPENGCMRVIPRTQRSERAIARGGDGDAVFDLSVAVDAAEEDRALDVCLRAGDLSVHDGRLVHGSEANRSARRRAGYTIRFADPRTVTVDVATHWVPVFRVAGDDRAGDAYVDARPGTTPVTTPR